MKKIVEVPYDFWDRVDKAEQEEQIDRTPLWIEFDDGEKNDDSNGRL